MPSSWGFDMKYIAPSILSSDFSRLADEIARVEQAGADMIHIDVMDGHFVPNLTFGPPVIAAIRKTTRLPFDVHLMIENPGRLLDDYIDAGADMLTVHIEAEVHCHRAVHHIKNRGVKGGVALNPSTPLSAIEEILADVDAVMIMAVNPGYGGQSFIPASLSKIRRLRQMLDRVNMTALIEVDGGVKIDNIADISAAGADLFVAGSAIFGTEDYRDTIETMRRRIDESVV